LVVLCGREAPAFERITCGTTPDGEFGWGGTSVKHNAGVLRAAPWGQKPHVDHKGKCCLDSDFQF